MNEETKEDIENRDAKAFLSSINVKPNPISAKRRRGGARWREDETAKAKHLATLLNDDWNAVATSLNREFHNDRSLNAIKCHINEERTKGSLKMVNNDKQRALAMRAIGIAAEEVHRLVPTVKPKLEEPLPKELLHENTDDDTYQNLLETNQQLRIALIAAQQNIFKSAKGGAYLHILFHAGNFLYIFLPRISYITWSIRFHHQYINVEYTREMPSLDTILAGIDLEEEYVKAAYDNDKAVYGKYTINLPFQIHTAHEMITTSKGENFFLWKVKQWRPASEQISIKQAE